jgi:hypothetical protein
LTTSLEPFRKLRGRKKKPPVVAVFFTSNMSKTDSGDAVGTDKEKQANNLKDTLIKGINKKNSGKDPNLQELPFQKNVSSEVGLKDSNNIAIETNLSGNNDQHRLANLRTKGCSVDSRSVSSSNSAEKRKRETGKTVESISLSGFNHSRESSSRRGPSRDGTSLIPGRVNSKLAESASSNKAPETVVSGSGSSLMRADDLYPLKAPWPEDPGASRTLQRWPTMLKTSQTQGVFLASTLRSRPV